MKSQLRIHILMLMSFIMCNACSQILAADVGISAEQEAGEQWSSVFSAPSGFDRDATEMWPAVGVKEETADLRGKRFEWFGYAESDFVEARIEPYKNEV